MGSKFGTDLKTVDTVLNSIERAMNTSFLNASECSLSKKDQPKMDSKEKVLMKFIEEARAMAKRNEELHKQALKKQEEEHKAAKDLQSRQLDKVMRKFKAWAPNNLYPQRASNHVWNGQGSSQQPSNQQTGGLSDLPPPAGFGRGMASLYTPPVSAWVKYFWYTEPSHLVHQCTNPPASPEEQDRVQKEINNIRAGYRPDIVRPAQMQSAENQPSGIAN